ncbi:Two component system response regulator/histidine kinase, PAS domain-containing [Desulfonema limicola]|uniref:histidine kinase n=1 Tax=Desulfonema limicola TaxID=45656 RepID=A0A975B3G9_9BACT|nr:PAS domain-containing protein [Desulfonema limicola]QTA78081.1 Two component system response regulator/histidine kinase, PAS domain-containing [Desulfonema limicola]
MNIFEMSAEKYGVLDHAPVGICVINDDYTILFWNRCLEDWTGITKKHILGKKLEKYFPDLGAPKYKKRLETIFEGGPPAIFSSQLHKYVFPCLLSNGENRIQHTTVSGIPAFNKKGYFALWAVTDVTELTQRIDKYRAMRNTALDEIQQRKKTEQGLKAANRKILEQQKAVIEEERLKVLLQMSGATAHELNQPLMSLLGNIELMALNMEDREKLVKHIKNIEEAGQRIAGIVKKIQSIRHYEIKPYMGNGSIVNIDQAISILFIEDSDQNFIKIKDAAKCVPQVCLFRAMGIESGIRILKNRQIDLVFSACLFLDGTGTDLLQRLKSEELEIPVIIISDQDDEITAGSMIHAGAYDYLHIDMINRSSFSQLVLNNLEKARLKREIREANKKISQISNVYAVMTG